VSRTGEQRGTEGPAYHVVTKSDRAYGQEWESVSGKAISANRNWRHAAPSTKIGITAIATRAPESRAVLVVRSRIGVCHHDERRNHLANYDNKYAHAL